MPATHVRRAFEEARDVLDAFLGDSDCLSAVVRFVDAAAATLAGGGTVYSCGNGGSMCDAMHFAEEWTGRFRKDRLPMPALALSDPSHLTCIGNDFGFDQVFARMVAAYGREGDLLVVFSTSGSSPNVVEACRAARAKGLGVVGLLGRGGGAVRELCDVAVVVPLATTSDRVQEVHIQVVHAVIEAVERRLFPHNYS
jgi:D-sedoheptulose 7-phosphate isomerase